MNVLNDSTQMVKVGKVRPHPQNPRVGNIDAIVDSIRVNGFYGALVVQKSTGHILAGNHRYLAAIEAGADEVPVIFVDVDDEEAKRILLADNRTADLGTYDEQQLVELLQSLDDTSGTGYSDDDLSDLLTALVGEPDAAADEIPPVPVEPKTQKGDLWVLGDHRVLCGDARNRDDVNRLLRNEPADYVFTSPPYGIDLEYEKGEPLDALRELVAAVIDVIDEATADRAYATMNYSDVFAPGEPGFTPVSDFYHSPFAAHGWVLRGNRIWLKPFGRLALAYGTSTTLNLREWEYVRTWRKGRGREKLRAHGVTLRGVWKTFGDDAILKDWRKLDVTTDKDVHPAAFPVSLPVTGLRAYTDRGAGVLDPFCGSGSTIIACELEKRRGRGVEIDPAYVDVICHRFEKVTGIIPVLERTGEAVSFL